MASLKVLFLPVRPEPVILPILYSALKDGSREAPKPNPFNTQVKEILETEGSGDGPSTRSNGANGFGVEGDMSCVIFEISEGILGSPWLIRRDWELTSKLAIDFMTDLCV